MQAQPHLFFEGRCEEAVESYRRALGAGVKMLMRFKDNPTSQDRALPPGEGDKTMHASLRIRDTMLLVSDGQCLGRSVFQGFGRARSPDKRAFITKRNRGAGA